MQLIVYANYCCHICDTHGQLTLLRKRGHNYELPCIENKCTNSSSNRKIKLYSHPYTNCPLVLYHEKYITISVQRQFHIGMST